MKRLSNEVRVVCMSLEKEMATHSSILGWRIHEQRSLVGYSPWHHKESDITERLTFHFSVCVYTSLLLNFGKAVSIRHYLLHFLVNFHFISPVTSQVQLGTGAFVSWETREFPVVRTPHFQCWGPGSIPDWWTGIPTRCVVHPKRRETWIQKFAPSSVVGQDLVESACYGSFHLGCKESLKKFFLIKKIIFLKMLFPVDETTCL